MKYSEVSSEVKKSIDYRYIVPNDTSKVFVDEDGKPYELYSGVKVRLTINMSNTTDNGFHSGSYSKNY